ncbi:MAG: F5/8 type C domain protein [Verrucomicrobia bacterium ADurb.Bin118]|nr:MAG: F5/8 type C domain protein [Verrucomicrobia bacterium ADurb.Bin118]
MIEERMGNIKIYSDRWLPALVGIAGLCVCATESLAADALLAGWRQPPPGARLRAYWWWLNGNVTSNAITRDLEEMKAKGFGGALICDADGSSQDGNARAPHGPTFFSPSWRALFRHTLHEADRLGLEVSLNIQSGWNLGGPMVTPDDAPKKLVWTETQVTGGTQLSQPLPQPKGRDGYYRDLFVLAYRLPAARATNQLLSGVTVSSQQPEHPAAQAVDQSADTYWVSANTIPGQGLSPERPEWIQLNFAQPVRARELKLTPRPGYGPRDGEVQASDDGERFQTVQKFSLSPQGAARISFPEVRARHFRVVCRSAYDPRFPDTPRNVQIAELRLTGPDGHWPQDESRTHPPLQHWLEKALLKPLVPFSAPDSSPLFAEGPEQPGEADMRATEVLDLTAHWGADGILRWTAPDGLWRVLRLGCTLNDHCRVSTCSEGWDGYALDPFDAGAFTRYWNAVVAPLIADAGPLAGRTLKYLHTDSWEVEVANWTPTLREEFRRRRGYDLLPWLPVITGRIVNSREESNRFLHDFRRTMGDLAIDNHYRLFKEGAHRHGMLIHPESGGPHAVPIDAQQCLGYTDAPMSEFWAWSWRHRVGDANRFFVKQPASAAHTYGRKLVLAEGFTTIGPHWQETLWDNLKPSFDQALCEGLNLLVWHAFVCSPASEGLPGQQYFAGTHLNPNVTWWRESGPFFDYLNRCQFMLQQGVFVADVAYYYGDHVPNFAQLKSSDPAKILPGYDYDVVTSEVILNRLSVKAGRLVLPDGLSYRLLVLPERNVISLPVLRKVKELVAAGATVVGPKPVREQSLTDYPQCDAEVRKLAETLWGATPPGTGRVISGKNARAILQADGVPPDFEFRAENPDAFIDYIHRRDGATEVYFVASRSNRTENVTGTFRVTGKAPELWNPVTGEHQFAAAYTEVDGRTAVPLTFAPYGSWFVVFREPAAAHPPTTPDNQPAFRSLGELTGDWAVKFAPEWGGPATAQFDRLISWTEHPEPGIKFYSGAATYVKSFDLPAATPVSQTKPLYLDLGMLRELAEVRVNGRSCGIVWAPPFRVDITTAVKPGKNELEIRVINFWPNRIIGDASLPADQRRTRTNIRKFTPDTPLSASGLFGPVQLLVQSGLGQ